MPYAPGIQYRGDQFLAQGISSLGERVQKELDTKKMEKRLVESYKTQGEAMGLDPEVLDKHSSLGALAGFIEGKKVKNAHEYEAAKMAQMKLHGDLYRQHLDANKAALADRATRAAALKGFSDYVGGEDAVPLQGPPNVQQEMVPPDPQEMQSRLDALGALASTQRVPMDAGQMFDVANQPAARLAPVPGGLGSVNVPRMERMTPADFMRTAARYGVQPDDQLKQAHALEYMAKAAKEMNGSGQEDHPVTMTFHQPTQTWIAKAAGNNFQIIPDQQGPPQFYTDANGREWRKEGNKWKQMEDEVDPNAAPIIRDSPAGKFYWAGKKAGGWRPAPMTMLEKMGLTAPGAVTAPSPPASPSIGERVRGWFSNPAGDSSAAAPAAASPPPPSAPAAREVIRETGDGRKAVFNAVTKEFIRYAD
ncbi:hypothetical protein LBMAG56_49430 [Verrucomicrobiota bacterium]|nr:hypothetical protein LBMAG56_49430 [Verrucomicrobiota bacterium]